MCFKKKDNKKITNSMFKLRDIVGFRYKGEMRRGTITNIEINANGEALYEVTMGGECPAVFNNLKDNNLIKLKK